LNAETRNIPLGMGELLVFFCIMHVKRAAKREKKEGEAREFFQR